MIWKELKAENPMVSVVMPAYNAERFIEEAIRSVMGQTFQNWELIVLDDCSSDSTTAVIEKLMREDDRISLVYNEQNIGVAKTRNHGLDLCKGSYIALLDSDDIWHPEKLEKQLDLAKTTGADIIYCSYGIINEYGVNTCEDFIVPETIDFERFLIKSVISCSTALLSQKIMKDYRFHTDFYHEDLELWYRLLRDGFQARGVTDVLAQYRVMEGTRASNKARNAVYRWRIYRNAMGFSALKSARLIIGYAVLGLRKYKKHTGTKNGNTRNK